MKYANYNILHKYNIDTENIYEKNTHRPVLYGISIDNNNASFYDDGINLIKKDGFYILQISITDITECIPFNSYLDLKAREILVDKEKTLLFPIHVKQQCLSLKEDQLNLTLTLEIKLNLNLEIMETKIYESAFINQKSYTYKSFDNEMFHKKAFKNPLVDRIAKFANKIHYLKTNNYTELSADNIVKCIMIFANEQIAKYCKKNNIPVIYENKAPLCHRKYTINQTLYTTFTSSMRKYNDIIVHSQIKAFLKNKETSIEEKSSYPFSNQMLIEIVSDLNTFNCKQNNNNMIKKSIINFTNKNHSIDQNTINLIMIEIENKRIEPFAIFYIIFSLNSSEELRKELFNIIKKNIINNWTKALFAFIRYNTIININLLERPVYKGQKSKFKKSNGKNSTIVINIANEEFLFTHKRRRNERLSSKAMEMLCSKLYKHIHTKKINIIKEIEVGNKLRTYVLNFFIV